MRTERLFICSQRCLAEAAASSLLELKRARSRERERMQSVSLYCRLLSHALSFMEFCVSISRSPRLLLARFCRHFPDLTPLCLHRLLAGGATPREDSNHRRIYWPAQLWYEVQVCTASPLHFASCFFAALRSLCPVAPDCCLTRDYCIYQCLDAISLFCRFLEVCLSCALHYPKPHTQNPTRPLLISWLDPFHLSLIRLHRLSPVSRFTAFLSSLFSFCHLPCLMVFLSLSLWGPGVLLPLGHYVFMNVLLLRAGCLTRPIMSACSVARTWCRSCPTSA